MEDGWRPTGALIRAALTATTLALAALVFGRPEGLVLAAPFAIHAAFAFRGRPHEVPIVHSTLGADTLREGAGTTLTVELDEAAQVEQVSVAVRPRRWLAARPAAGAVSRLSAPTQRKATVSLPVASLRWGRRPFGDGRVGALSRWAGYEWGPVALATHELTTLPVPGGFDSRVDTPHPIGLVGAHPARRRGDGYDLDSVRRFQPGDRLRRVQWRVSLRTGELHVTSTHAEEDASVLLVVDGGVEVGLSGGVHGRASSLDVAVRAAGAVAEHCLARGDRVGVRVLGSTTRNVVPSSAGAAHLRRVLATLAHVVPGEDRHLETERLRFQVTAGTMVLVFSPMLSQASVAVTTLLASRGLDVVVVDSLPDDVDLGGTEPHLRVAWRMRVLERRALLARAERAGIPVVAWRGPGTLDEVLRRLQRRPASVVRR